MRGQRTVSKKRSRGRSRSRRVDEVYGEVKMRHIRGYRIQNEKRREKEKEEKPHESHARFLLL